MKIGIIRIDRMGDMILTLPIIKSIKSLDSAVKINVFVSNKNEKIIKNFKYIDEIINIDQKKNFNKEKYDLLLNFSPGWKSFFICLFSKSLKKGNIIYTSRYKNKSYSKILIFVLSKIFFQKTLFINRIKKFKNKENIHQTQAMFDLLNMFNFSFKKNVEIESYFFKNKILKSNKNICLIHLSAKWINNYYTENDFLNLVEKLEQKFNLVLTSDYTTKKKFLTIFNKFQTINNKNFDNLDKIYVTTIFDNLNFKNWTQAILLSNLVITPECGCTHIAALCKIPSKIIYDPNNKPDMIYAEYAPYKSKHEKYIFNEKNLNMKLCNNL